MALPGARNTETRGSRRSPLLCTVLRWTEADLWCLRGELDRERNLWGTKVFSEIPQLRQQYQDLNSPEHL